MKPRLRGLSFLLECGHSAVASTSFYRLTQNRVAAIKDNSIRNGLWCSKCNVNCQPKQYYGTCRLEGR